MTEVLQANIFFLITSIAVVIFSIIVILILFQIYRIIKLIRMIMEKFEAASELMAEDAATIRKLVANRGLVASVISFMLGNKRGRRKSDIEPEEDNI